MNANVAESGAPKFSIVPPTREILRIASDGQMLRGDRPIDDLPHEELVAIISELVGLIRAG